MVLPRNSDWQEWKKRSVHKRMSDSEEFRLKIEAYTPSTIPMSRLAEYLAELATMLGETASVHFARLEPGSTSIVHRIASEAIPKIRARTQAVRRGVGPRDAVRAYRQINKLLRDDNGTAVWKRGGVSHPSPIEPPEVVFPGRDESQEIYSSIQQRGSLDGEVVRVGGFQKLVPVLLQAEQQEIAGCWTDRTIAKALARRLFEPVRLFGTGRWNRNDDGVWKLDKFRVESFQAIKQTSLSAALTELRKIELPWNEETFAELSFIRSGSGDANGGL